MHNGSSRRSYRSDCQTLRRPAESERPFDSRSRGRSESRRIILIRKLLKARAWRVASTPTKNARCKLLLHHPIGELTRRGDFHGGCTVRHVAGWRSIFMDLTASASEPSMPQARPRTLQRGRPRLWPEFGSGCRTTIRKAWSKWKRDTKTCRILGDKKLARYSCSRRIDRRYPERRIR